MSSGGCQLHPGEKVVGQCGICGKTICIVCTKLYGYFCSPECRAKAKARAPVGSQSAAMAAYGSNLMKVTRLFMITVVPLTALVLGIFIIWKVTSREGKIVWTFKPEKDRPFSGIVSAGDCLVAACDNAAVYGIDKRSGQALWGFDGKAGIAQRPPQQSGHICIVNDYETLYGIDTRDGKPIWQHPFPEAQQPEPVVSGKYVAYLYHTMREMTTEEQQKTIGPIRSNRVVDASALCVIKLDDGRELWRKTLKKAFFAGGELAVGNESIYYGTHTAEEDLEEPGKATAKAPNAPAGTKPEPKAEPKVEPKAEPKAEPKTDPKEEPKTEPKPAPKVKPAGDSKAPAKEDDPINVQEITTKFTITAYDAMSERAKWKAVLEGGSGYSINMQSIPTGVLITTSSNLYSLAEADGKLLWKYPIPKIGYLFWTPQVRGDLIFIPGNNVLHCISLKTGQELWQYKSEDESDPSEPQVEGDSVFLTTYVQEERKTGTTGEGLPTYRGTEELVKELQKDMPKQRTVSVSELLALDAATGKPKWRLRDVGSNLFFGNGVLVALRYHTFAITTETRITAIQSDTGRKLWESTYIGRVMNGWTDGRLFYISANSGVEHVTMSSRQPPRDNIIGAYSISR